MKYQCTECDIESPNTDVFKQLGCMEKHHQIIKVMTKWESSKALEKAELNQDNVFQIHKDNESITKVILDHKIQVLRPQTLTKTGKKIILVYLPTKETITKGNGEKTSTSHVFTNTAYFVMSKPKASIGPQREIIPYDHISLTEKFRIDVLPNWNDVRWEISDLMSWIKESELSNPAQLYNLLYNTTRNFIEFEDESEYVKFVLWNIGTYCFELFDAYPYNDYTGTKRAGKSKCLEFQKLVCYNAVMSPDITSSSTFRMIQGLGATMLFDETEQFKNPRNDQAQQVRTLLLQGFLKNQFAVRSEGKERGGFTPVPYNLYSPKSLAHINALDDVLEDRCIQQINKRSTNLKIKNTWPTEKDHSFQQIRNLCYRLFLDYADEITELQEEARDMLSVSGRELQLWTPIITLAWFFEKHGTLGLTEAVKNSVSQSSQDRQMLDEQESKPLRVLSFLSDKGVMLAQNKEIIKNNPTGWIPISELYAHFKIVAHNYEINPEYFTRNTLTQTLHRLGFKQARKEDGISWLITSETVLHVRKQQDLEPLSDNSKITSFTSESSVHSDSRTDSAEYAEVLENQPKSETTANVGIFEPKTEQTESSECSEANMGCVGQTNETEVLNNTEVSETTAITETTAKQFYCKTHDAGPFPIHAESKSSGNILNFHQRLNCQIEFS